MKSGTESVGHLALGAYGSLPMLVAQFLALWCLVGAHPVPLILTRIGQAPPPLINGMFDVLDPTPVFMVGPGKDQCTLRAH